jgi:hypothetical protein
MPAISITNDQRERLRWVQRRLGEDLDYGHVRPRDALEYLLDRFDESDADDPSAERAAGTGGTGRSGGAGAPAAGDASVASTPDTETTVAATPQDTSEFVVRNADVVGGDEGSGNGSDQTGSAAATDETPEPGPETSDGGASDGESSGGDVATGDADGGATLNSMMSLLDDHDGKWREAGGGEEKYEVDLPDGGTERARTKDDVRAVLFKHYR